MYCPHCGAPLQGDPRFCPKCGTALRPADTPPDGTAPKNPPEDPGRGSKKKAPVVLVGAVALVAVVAIVACVMVFGDGGGASGGDSDSDTGTAAESTDSTETAAVDTATTDDAAVTDDAGSSTPTSATTYYTDADGEEALYGIITYHANGTVASTWYDSSVMVSDYEVDETSSTYDEDGNLLTRSWAYESSSYGDDHSQTATYSYICDSSDRPVLITVTVVYEEDGESEEGTYFIAVNYEGDALSSIELEYPEQEGLYGAVYTADFTVDEAGDIVQVDFSYTLDGETEDIISVLYEYDADGNVTKATYGGEGGSSAVIYSMCALLLQPLAATRPCLDSYLALGFVQGYDYSTYEYDELGNLVTYQAVDEGEVVSEGAYELSYTYDDEGRVIECVQASSDWDFSYRIVYEYE